MKTNNLEISESSANASMDTIAEGYLGKYHDYVNIYESNCTKAKAGQAVTSADIAAFGKCLDIWESYHSFCENNGTLSDLGPIPNIALDVIAAVQTKNILPLISSTQPIDEQQGIVYAKQITAIRGTNSDGSGLGGVSAGDVLNDTLNGDRVHDPLFGAARRQYSASAPFFTTAGAATSYTVAVQGNLLPNTLRLQLVDGATTYTILDDGLGQILGTNGVSGTVNYETGSIVVNFGTAPADDLTVTGRVDYDVEAEGNMVTINTGYTGIPVHANFYGLKSESSILQNFSFAKRWGRSSEDEHAQDLADELTNTLNSAGIDTIVRGFSGGANNTTTYEFTPPAGVSDAEHKLSFINQQAEAEQNLANRAGRGAVNRYIAGTRGAAFLRSLPGFKPVAGGTMQQVGLYGYLDGIPVIRGTDTLVNQNVTTGGAAGDDDIYGLYMGSGAFDAPMVNAPYIPIFVTGTMNVDNNPLRSQRAIGTMTAIQTVVPRYITRIRVDRT